MFAQKSMCRSSFLTCTCEQSGSAKRSVRESRGAKPLLRELEGSALFPDPEPDGSKAARGRKDSTKCRNPRGEWVQLREQRPYAELALAEFG